MEARHEGQGGNPPTPAPRHPLSAAADGDDDFQAVTAGKQGGGVLAARHYLAVLFDGDSFSRQVERLDQLREGEVSRKTSGLAVDDQFNHKSRLFYPWGMSFSRIPDSNLKDAGTARASYSGIT